MARHQCTCAHCGAVFSPRPDNVERGWGVYCSRACLYASQRRPRLERTCPICGTAYAAMPSRVARGKQTTCSRACSYRLRMLTRRPVGRPHPERPYRKDPARVLAKNAAYREAHRAELSAKQVAYYAAHREQAKAIADRRRARVKGCAINDLTVADWLAILDEWGHRCAYCGATGVKLTKDHVVALARGGDHTRANVVPACRPCNCRKWCHPAAHIKTSWTSGH